jgi:hypothetical protein
MACNDPYENPAGLKFVTRTQITAEVDGADNPLWPDDLPYLEDRLIMNVPNGAGPGTVILQSANAYVEWRIVGTKNLVRSTQRAYTGAASWEEVFVEDGCFIYARAQSTSTNVFNVDGIITTVANTLGSLKALWFPNGANIPTFDRLSLISGGISPTADNGFPMRNIADGASAYFAPPGLCRYFQVSLNGAFNWNLVHDGDSNSAYQGTQAATGLVYGFCPAWLTLQVTNDAGSLESYSIGWNRFPMTGS